MRLSAVIVTYNSAAHIASCLEALRPWLGAWVTEVIVVDNASIDTTRDLVAGYPFYRLLANPSNTGFAAAVNQGVRASSSEAILLLNPDAVISYGLDHLASALEQERTGAAGGQLLTTDGAPQAGFQVRRFPTALTLCCEVLGVNRLFPGNPVNRRYRSLDLDPAQACDVDQPAGAFLAFRRSAWAQIGGFDESFHPLWFEDVDFCLRLTQAGWRIRYEPAAAARHSGAHSISTLGWGSRQLFWYGSLLRYVARHMGTAGRLAVCGSLGLAAGPRTVAGIFRRRSFQPVIVFGRVLQMTAACMLGLYPGSPAEDKPARDRC
jgi:N-acetylglucosaminyl-diphospho-decaprenol L-rhamnosyltransferase